MGHRRGETQPDNWLSRGAGVGVKGLRLGKSCDINRSHAEESRQEDDVRIQGTGRPLRGQ